jgi:soluble cytochrome b562
MSASRRFSLFAALVAGLVALAPAAFAGPIADYETALRAAYADYRNALFATNTKNRDGSDKTMAALDAKWSALVGKYRSSPPPHYSEDAKWAASLDQVSGVLARAKAEIAKGELAEAHETLEAVRERLGELRARNGLIAYSDRIDAFHHFMESVLTKPYGGLTGAGLTELVEDAAVLAFLGNELKKSPPADAAQSADFAPLLAAMLGAVGELQAAARTGNVDAIKAARGKIKPAFAKLFVKFG